MKKETSKDIILKTAYIIVHAEDYALENSSLISDPRSYKWKLRSKLEELIKQGSVVIFLKLEDNGSKLPDYIKHLDEGITVIPSKKKDLVNAQSEELKIELLGNRRIKRVILTGGWKYACLKHTLKNTFIFSKEIKRIDWISSFIDAEIIFKDKKKKVLLTIDKKFVF